MDDLSWTQGYFGSSGPSAHKTNRIKNCSTYNHVGKDQICAYERFRNAGILNVNVLKVIFMLILCYFHFSSLHYDSTIFCWCKPLAAATNTSDAFTAFRTACRWGCGYLRDVLLWLIELLLQVAGRGLAGDFDHGQLFVVAGHVARCPAHAVAALHGRQFSFTQEGRWRGRERKIGGKTEQGVGGWVGDDEHKGKMLF